MVGDTVESVSPGATLTRAAYEPNAIATHNEQGSAHSGERNAPHCRTHGLHTLRETEASENGRHQKSSNQRETRPLGKTRARSTEAPKRRPPANASPAWML